MSPERACPLVLVTDDDPDILELLEMVLMEEYDVISATDGEMAVRLTREQLPDICVIDVMMPKLDGVQVTAAIRADQATRHIPIILLSARTQWESITRGREAGANEYLTKPFVAEDLQRAIRSLVADQSSSEEEAAPPPPEVVELVQAAARPAPAPQSSHLILVAASDPNVVKLVSYRFHLGGYQVIAAPDPGQATALAAQHSPALCILDATMPQLNGLPFVRIESRFSVQELYDAAVRVLADGAAAQAESQAAQPSTQPAQPAAPPPQPQQARQPPPGPPPAPSQAQHTA